MNNKSPVRRSKRLLMKKMGTELKIQESSSTADIPNEQMKTWSDLPYELLGQIGDRLPLLELLGFRSACKDWRSASSTASAECEYTADQEPWFLLYNDDSNCLLYQPSQEKVYTIHIPEMDGATCIASKEGWILPVRDSSLFFFCPFSHAKIDLPKFPHSDLSDHVAVFSSTPTSPDCVVCVINHFNSKTMELNMLKRGDKEWAKYIADFSMKAITDAAFRNGIFYFFDSYYRLLTFSIDNKEWCRYKIVYPPAGQNISKLPFQRIRKECDSNMKQKFGLEESDSVSTCGTVQRGNVYDTLIENKDFLGADEKKQCHNKGVWIHPRFFQIPPNQSWSL